MGVLGLATVALSGAALAQPLSLHERLAWHVRLETVLAEKRMGLSARGAERLASASAIRRKVELDLRRSAALASYWEWPIEPAHLQAEMDRMATHTRDRALLEELFGALGNDPYLIAECLARPALARRRFADRIAADGGIVAGSPESWLDGLALAPGWDTPELDRARLRAPRIAPEICCSAFAGVAPEARNWHSAVWTGSEMIVWGGAAYDGFDNGARYEPVTDTWSPTSTGAGTPSPRMEHTAVWTGTEMIVWGGGFGEWLGGNYATGGRYDPLTDTWRPTSTVNAPSARFDHTAVWTGTEMIVWGGRDGTVYMNGGGRYDPAIDVWTPTRQDPTTPPAAYDHTAVWTGAEMIVWGGFDGGAAVDTGGRYDPVADAWAPTARSGAPAGMAQHTAVWSGSEMIVWGTDAGRYDPASDTWAPVYPLNAPAPRIGHSAFWTGTEMLVWGGDENPTIGTGGLYDPALDRWRTMSQGANAPMSRVEHAAVFTGTELLVWSGGGPGYSYDDGARWRMESNTWSPMSSGAAVPAGRTYFSMEWTGVEVVVWGGISVSGSVLAAGAAYAVATDTWSPMSISGAPAARSGHVGAWTGAEFLVWGGSVQPGLVQTGGRWDPVSDTWRATAIDAGTPSGRYGARAVWSGAEMIVWGGDDGTSAVRTGGMYAPATDSWRPVSTTGAPFPRAGHASVWTGAEMIVWGGYDATTAYADGGRYDPSADSWTAITVTGAPEARSEQAAVWTGAGLLVWGGSWYRTGGIYDPVTDTWRPTTLVGAPSARTGNTAAWTGSELLVWGGWASGFHDTGGAYDPTTDAWRATATIDAPTPRTDARAVWTGSEMIVWGGNNGGSDYPRIGGLYDPPSDSWWKGPAPPPVAVLCAKGPGGSSAHDTRITGMAASGRFLAGIDAFPTHPGTGARIGGGDVDGDGSEEVLAAPGPGSANPPLVRGFGRLGAPVPGLDFTAYGASGFGANVAAGSIDGAGRILTGPGPSGAYGPQVRGFRYAAGTVVTMGKVNFFAYGTLRFGVNVAAGATDGDAFDEIVAAAGPGGVFGPHVRAFDYDGIAVAPVPGVSFFAYGTPRYGVNAGTGDIDGDGFGEILTGPGPSPAFGPQLRAFDVDGGTATAIGSVNAFVFTGPDHGLRVAGGDVDDDGFDEIAAGAGPDPTSGSLLRGLDHDGAALRGIACLTRDVFGISHGIDVAVAKVAP